MYFESEIYLTKLIIKIFKIYDKIKKEKSKKNGFSFFAGHLQHSSSSYAVFRHGRFLLDASGRNLLLLVDCESLQYQQ